MAIFVNGLAKNHSLDSVEHAELNPIFPCQPFWPSAILNFVVKCYILRMQ